MNWCSFEGLLGKIVLGLGCFFGRSVVCERGLGVPASTKSLKSGGKVSVRDLRFIFADSFEGCEQFIQDFFGSWVPPYDCSLS